LFEGLGESAPGHSNECSLYASDKETLLKKYFFLEITFKKGPDELTAALSAAHEEEDTYVI
jgi:hypothetical protein